MERSFDGGNESFGKKPNLVFSGQAQRKYACWMQMGVCCKILDGFIEKYKARLVAKGFAQTYGIDYQETFAPIFKLNTITILLSLAANLDW